MRTFVLATVLSFIAQNALADQCVYLTSKGQAESAKRLLGKSKKIQEFCELCKDTTPTDVQLQSVDIEVIPEDPPYFMGGRWIVRINGSRIDLRGERIVGGTHS